MTQDVAAQLEELRKANTELVEQLNSVRLENKGLQRQYRSGKPEPLGYDQEDFGLDVPSEGAPRGVNDLRVLSAARRKGEKGSPGENRLSQRRGSETKTVERWGTTTPSSKKDEMEEEPEPKTAEQSIRIIEALKKRPPFDTLDAAQLKRVVVAMTSSKAKASEVLVRQGEEGNLCYLVEEGELKVTVGKQEVDTIKAGGGALRVAAS